MERSFILAILGLLMMSLTPVLALTLSPIPNDSLPSLTGQPDPVTCDQINARLNTFSQNDQYNNQAMVSFINDVATTAGGWYNQLSPLEGQIVSCQVVGTNPVQLNCNMGPPAALAVEAAKPQDSQSLNCAAVAGTAGTFNCAAIFPAGQFTVINQGVTQIQNVNEQAAQNANYQQSDMAQILAAIPGCVTTSSSLKRR